MHCTAIMYCTVLTFIVGTLLLIWMLTSRFVASGLMRREYDRVKLHCTLVNTLFRREEGDMGDTGQGGKGYDARRCYTDGRTFSFGRLYHYCVVLYCYDIVLLFTVLRVCPEQCNKSGIVFSKSLSGSY